jgi:DNA-binding transcriptional ArsR family regulator
VTDVQTLDSHAEDHYSSEWRYLSEFRKGCPMTVLSAPTVQVLERALDILEALAGSPSGLGISEIAAKTQLPVSTVHRLLKVLKRRGYAAQDPETRKYLILRKLPPQSPEDAERVGQLSGHAV